jgi:hypothetical protein
MTYDIGNPGPVLGQTQTCSKVKFVWHGFKSLYTYI